jgi:DNA-binding response OmpR family regulator
MWNDRSTNSNELIFQDVGQFVREAPRRSQELSEERREAPLVYRLAIGREPIRLGKIEFRILLLLASRPYKPFSRERIAEAISTEQTPIAEDAIDAHVAELREKLGFFRDYVQTVPYMGYRFKA